VSQFSITTAPPHSEHLRCVSKYMALNSNYLHEMSNAICARATVLARTHIRCRSYLTRLLDCSRTNWVLFMPNIMQAMRWIGISLPLRSLLHIAHCRMLRCCAQQHWHAGGNLDAACIRALSKFRLFTRCELHLNYLPAWQMFRSIRLLFSKYA
jgi:hypothetical protein